MTWGFESPSRDQHGACPAVQPLCRMVCPTNGLVAQLEERVSEVHRVGGPIPPQATNTGQPSGDVLPPYCLPHHLRVAQLVERPAVNREVAGSRPAARAMPPIPLGDDARRGLRCPCLSEWFDPIWRFLWCVAQWSEHSVDNGEVAGSNPAAPTIAALVQR